MESATTYDRVRDCLVEALAVDADEVTPDASLHQDLGAESIDLLDITFRLEREFGININDDELFPSSIFADDAECVKDGIVTAKGMQKLKEAIPHGDFSKLGDEPKPDQIPAVFTVNTLVRYVETKLEQRREVA